MKLEVAGLSTMNIVMSAAYTDLDAVVVIGYGSQKRKEVTGAVSSIKEDDFNSGVKTNPIGLLQGKVAGLTIQRSGSSPTSTGFNIQIRGFSTLDKGAGTSPLFIVDGIPVNNIDNVSPDDIVSMDVLKDGSAAAIYGTRGTNGVIIITTKRGDGLKATGAPMLVEYAGYVSASTRVKNTGMSTPEEYKNLSQLSGGQIEPVIYTGPNGETYTTDWMKEMTRPVAFTHNHNIAVSGAGTGMSYRGSLNYKNSEGIAQKDNRKELIGKLTLDQTALDGWLKIQYDLSYMHYRNDYFTGSFEQAATLNPTYPIYDATTESGYFAPQGSGQSNPVELLNQRESYQDGNYFRGSIRPTINIKTIDGLKLSAFMAFEEGTNHTYWYNDIINTDKDNSNMAGIRPNRSMNRLYEATLDYANNFGIHNIAAIAGLSYQNFEYDGHELSNGGFPVSTIKYYSMADGEPDKSLQNISSYRNSNTLAAVFARVNYSYDDKYLLSASIRREGSSRFGENNKWGYFPAASVGWRMKSEDFMKTVDFVNDLKLRFGFGVTGNNLAADLQSLSLYTSGGTFWYNGQWVTTYAVSRNVNPDLRWEKKFEYNLGVDYALWGNRLYGTIDAYIRNTKDLLWEYYVPSPPYQYDRLLANAGEMVSKGIEITVNAVAVKTRDFSWTTTPIISFNDSKITKLSDPSKGFNYETFRSGQVGGNGINGLLTQILITGESIGTFYGYRFVGTDPNGTRAYESEDGGVTGNPRSPIASEKGKLQVLGSAQPLFSYGWNNTLKYKNWDLGLFFRGTVGNKIFNVTRVAYGPDGSSASSAVFMKDVPNAVRATKSFFSDYYLEDGSYLKLDNLTLGYNHPVKANKYVRSVRLYFTAQNVFTLTGYSGADPEVNTTSVWNAGIDYVDFYPSVRNFMLGVNLTFY